MNTTSITPQDLQAALRTLLSQAPSGQFQPTASGPTPPPLEKAGGDGGAPPGPSLPPPSLSPSAMMIAMQALNSKVFETSIKFGETALDGSRKDIKDAGEKRLKELTEHFENLEKATRNKKCGFFGALGKIFKALFTLDFAELGDVLKNSLGPMLKDLASLIGAALAIAVAAAGTAASFGGATPALALAIMGAVALVASMAMSDPAITEAIVNSLPDDQKQTAAMALMITSLVVGVVASAMSIAGSAGANTAAAGMKIATTITDITGTLISAGVSIGDGVQEYQRAGFEQDALKNEAAMLRLDAFMDKLKTGQTTFTSDLKGLAEALARSVENTMSTIKEYGKLQNIAAKA